LKERPTPDRNTKFDGQSGSNHASAGITASISRDSDRFLEKGTTMIEPVMMAALAVVLITAIGTDLRSARIPNWLTFPAMGLALLGHTWLGGMYGGLLGLAGLAMGLGLLMPIYVVGAIGAGDVKLMAAVGAFVGPYGVLECGWLAFVVGGIYALGAMCYQWGWAVAAQRLIHGTYEAVLVGGSAWTRELQLPFRLRYGLAVAIGTLLFQTGVHPFGG
jgi:prepilin peptidase CpaA